LPPLRIATRGSELAVWQAEHVASLVGAPYELVRVDTVADRRQDIAIWEMGGKGVFVKEVQAAVLDGRADIAVHSGKDLPSQPVDGLVLAAVPERGDPRDALVGCRLADLPVGGRVATGSVRRRAQLADLRPDLTFAGLRGNMRTRLAKAEGFDAIVVAAVALERLGLAGEIAEVLEPSVLLPQVAQGALAVECRADDTETQELLAAIEHAPSRRVVDAERAFLAELGGDCSLPAGAHAVLDGDARLVLDALLASADGHVVLRHRVAGDEPVSIGTEAARDLLERGGAALLAP
jgi:hydroxymethylbilane synthase